MADQPGAADHTTGSVSYVDPEGLHKNPAFTNVAVVEGPVRTVHVGGQNAVDGTREPAGGAGGRGAGPEHVVKWNLLVVEGESLEAGFSAFRRAWGDPPSPPAITMAFVAGLANPDYLVEMDALAVVSLSATPRFADTWRPLAVPEDVDQVGHQAQPPLHDEPSPEKGTSRMPDRDGARQSIGGRGGKRGDKQEHQG